MPVREDLELEEQCVPPLSAVHWEWEGETIGEITAPPSGRNRPTRLSPRPGTPLTLCSMICFPVRVKEMAFNVVRLCVAARERGGVIYGLELLSAARAAI